MSTYKAANSICGKNYPSEPMTNEAAEQLPWKVGNVCPHCGKNYSGDIVAYIENIYEGICILECGACKTYYKKPYREVFTGKRN